MSRSSLFRGVLVGVMLLIGSLVALPALSAQAGVPDPYTGWVHRDDGTTGSGTTYTVPADDVLQAFAAGSQVDVYDDSDQSGLAATFTPPAGQTLQAGHTYHADVSQTAPTSTEGRVVVWRDGTMCGRTSTDLYAGYRPPPPVIGWFHVSELDRDADGAVTRFAATYELNCQFLGGSPGFEGSVAVNSASPAVAVPAAPAAPGPVTGLAVRNVGPNGVGDNTTTLTWTNPADFGDVEVDMVQSTGRAKLPALLGVDGTRVYLGRATRYVADVEFMDSRTYRLVARGTTGRLGPPAFVTVLGSRLSIPDSSQTITIGHPVNITGRLSEAWDYVNPADVANGPGLASHTVVLCRQARINYVDSDCTRVDTVKTTADGHFTLTATPDANTVYSITVPATNGVVGNISHYLTTLVAPQTDLRAPESVDGREIVTTASLSSQAKARKSVRRGSIIHFTTSRARAGSKGIVRLQRLDGKKWHTIVTRRLGHGSKAGRLAVPYREHRRGHHAYRIVKVGDAHHVNGHSRIVYVRVR